VPTTPTYPGVYIEEIPSGVRTITGVSTSIAAFVDYFDRGPMNQAVQLFNMGDFQREFGGLNSQSEASYAIQQFFLNGGTEAWGVRAASNDPTEATNKPTEADVRISGSISAAGPVALIVKAINAGEWGNHLSVRVDNGARDGEFNLIVSEHASVGNSVVRQETFRNLSIDDKQTNFVKAVVNDPNTGSKLVRVEASGGTPPLANGTLSDELDSNRQPLEAPKVQLPRSPKVKVTIGGELATAHLNFPDNVDLSNSVLLTTIAPALQSALRESRPDRPAFAGATVEVLADQLRILAGPGKLADRVVFENVTPSTAADDLLLTVASNDAAKKVTNQRATLSGMLSNKGPLIPAASPVDISIGTGGTPTTIALDFTERPTVKLPNPVALKDIAEELQAGTDEAGEADSAFSGIKVHVVEDNRLLVLYKDHTNPVVFANTSGTPTGVKTADSLKLRTAANINADKATNLMATLSRAHNQNPSLSSNPKVKVTIGADGGTVPLGALSGSVGLEAIASKLQEEIPKVKPGTAAFEVKVHIVEDNRLLVLSGSETDPVKFENESANDTTADKLKLVIDANDPSKSATNLKATLSGVHTKDPAITAAPPFGVTIGTHTVTRVLDFSNSPGVMLPNNVTLDDIAAKLQGAIGGASAPFNAAKIHAVEDNRLLVLSGSDVDPVECANTPGSTVVDALKLVVDVNDLDNSAISTNATLSGVHAEDPTLQPDPEVDVSIDNHAAVAPLNFSDLSEVTLPGPVGLKTIAPRLQAAIRGVEPTNLAFNDLRVYAVEKQLIVLPGGTDPTVQASFDKPAENMTAASLGLTAKATANLQEYALASGAIKDTAQVGGAEGKNGVPPGAGELVGGIDALEGVDLFNLLCIPRVAELPAEKAKTVISVAQTYCERRRAFFLIDAAKGIDEPQDVKNWVAANIPRHRNAAFFYPRVKIADPLDDFRLRSVGASGTLAGLFARTDSTRGIWKAPAGTAATLVNVSQLDDVLTDQENGTLNQLAINCLRNFPIYGNVAWGARTLEGSDQQASEWKYIPIRRLALFLEESLYRGIKWVVFEPNDEPLWAQIRLNVGAFMHNLFRQGAFQGQTPREAYFVKCDAETTTQNDINLGIVNIVVGFAPLKPAEFVILKIQQMAGQIET
jgi:phage tail sheath protein FI